jgi:hypothetical protein
MWFLYLTNILTGKTTFFNISHTIYPRFLIGKLQLCDLRNTLCLYSKDVASAEKPVTRMFSLSVRGEFFPENRTSTSKFNEKLKFCSPKV